MPEIVGTFLSTELRDERANRSSEARNSSCGNLAQESFELAVRHLDRIEVRRVLRQVTNCAPRFLDRLPNAGTHVDSAVIHYDNLCLGASESGPARHRRGTSLRSWHPQPPLAR